MNVNQWFLSLPEGRQKVLRDDKWLLAQASADAATTQEREACAVFLENQKYRVTEDHSADKVLQLLRRTVNYFAGCVRKGEHESASTTPPAPQSEWTPCNDWGLLPDGDWLVKIDNARKPYHVARAFTNSSGKICIVGGMFSFDAGNLIAYSPFGRYE